MNYFHSTVEPAFMEANSRVNLADDMNLSLYLSLSLNNLCFKKVQAYSYKQAILFKMAGIDLHVISYALLTFYLNF